MNPRPRSATDGGTAVAAVAATATTAGERFARALAVKDSGALCALLADPVDFQALTPGRHWQAGTGRQAVEEIASAGISIRLTRPSGRPCGDSRCPGLVQPTKCAIVNSSSASRQDIIRVSASAPVMK